MKSISGFDDKMAKINCSCSVIVTIDNREKQTDLEQSFHCFLQDIKMPFDIIQFVPTTNEPTELFEMREILARNPQTLAVCLFLKEPSDSKSAHHLKSQLLSSPWKLNHVIEIPPTKIPRKIARQEFYSLSNHFPLWSISTVHYGNEHVRFHINVKNLRAMKKFYEALTDRKARHCGPHFCFLTIYSENGMDVQIGLKFCPKISPSPSKSFRLKFSIQSSSPLFKHLESETSSTELQTNYILEDPDGNEVMVERSQSSENVKSAATVDDHQNKSFCSVLKDGNNNLIDDRKSGFKQYIYDQSEDGLSLEETSSYENVDCEQLVCQRHNFCSCDVRLRQSDHGDFVTLV